MLCFGIFPRLGLGSVAFAGSGSRVDFRFLVRVTVAFFFLCYSTCIFFSLLDTFLF